MTTGNEKENRAGRKNYNGSLTFYHANSKGTGAAARLELKTGASGWNRHGCFFLEMAQQKTVAGRREGKRTPATFDWESKATVKLSFMDVCEFLTVLEGRKKELGDRGRGLYHETNDVNTIISFKRNEERCGYNLGISRKNGGGEIVFRGHILLGEAEAIGVKSVFEAGLFHMAFHSSILE